MRLTRRNLLQAGLVGGGVALFPMGMTLADRTTVIFDVKDSPPVPSFAVPLNIPQELRPDRSTATTDFYTITQRVAQRQILPGLGPATIWAYEGQLPGPTITQRQGRDVVVRQINRLPVPVTTHLHGGDVPADSDGHPLDLVQPGAFKDYFYPGLHPAASLWYHDHAVHETGRNVWMGLAGFYRVIDDREQRLPLPKGRFDIPLIVMDRFFLRDGSIAYPRHDEERPEQQGAFGDVVLVNGTPKPFFNVERRKYLFRFLNASNARVYQFRLSSQQPLTVVGTEGGLVPHPIDTPEITMSPSERIAAVIDFSRYPVGTRVVLRNTFGDVPGDPFDEEKTRDVMRFDVVSDATDPTSIPRDLAPLPEDIRPDQSVATRNWEFERSGGRWVINGKPWDPRRIDARPRLGTVEIWRFENKSGGWLHPIHPHLVEFLPLDRTRRPLRPYERGPKDTILLGPNEVARVAIRWNSHRGVYAFHCHNIEHEDHDMMTQIEVV